MVTGILGGCIGTLLSRSFRDRVPHVDPLICAIGLLGSVPCIITSIFTASASIASAYARDSLKSASLNPTRDEVLLTPCTDKHWQIVELMCCFWALK